MGYMPYDIAKFTNPRCSRDEERAYKSLYGDLFYEVSHYMAGWFLELKEGV